MDILRILAKLHDQRDRINQAIAALESLKGSASSSQTFKAVIKTSKSAPGTKPTAKKRVISPEGRQRMADAQQKRWAKKKRAVKAAAKKSAAAVVPAKVKPATGTAKKTASKSAKSGLTAAARKRMSEAAKQGGRQRRRSEGCCGDESRDCLELVPGGVPKAPLNNFYRA